MNFNQIRFVPTSFVNHFDSDLDRGEFVMGLPHTSKVALSDLLLQLIESAMAFQLIFYDDEIRG